MNNIKKYSLLLTFGLLMSTLSAISALAVTPAAAQTGGADWPMFRYDLANTGFNPDSSGPYPLKMEWAFETDGPVRSSPAIVGGRVYFGSTDTYLYCVTAPSAGAYSGPETHGVPDGQLVWKYKTGDAVHSSPAVVGGRVYFGSADKNVYCLDASSGSLVWKFETGYWVFSSPAVSDGKVYIMSNDNYLYCLDANNGAQIWKFKTRDMTVSTFYWNEKPAVVGGKVFFGANDNYVYCLDALNGTKYWDYKASALTYGYVGGRYSGWRECSPCVVNNVIYIGNRDYHWYAINASTGAEIWSIKYNEAIGVAAPSDNIVQDSAAYAYGKLYHIWPNPHMAASHDPATGMVIGMFMMGQLPRSSISIADHKAYVSNNDRYIYVGNADDMNQRMQSYGLPQIVESTPSIAGGKMYIGCGDRHMYCFGSGDTQWHNTLMVTPAPRTVSLGEPLTVSGAINPYHLTGPEGQTISMHYVRPDGSAVTQNVVSGLASVFSDSFTPDVEGEWKVKATWVGNPWWLASESYYQNFWVTAAKAKTSTTIGASVSNATLVTNQKVTISGTITPAVPGVIVTLTYTKPGGSSLTRTSLSGLGGAYTDTYTPDAEGSWTVSSSWAGNDQFSAASSSAAAFTVSSAGQAQPTGTAIPMEIIYAVVAIIVIAIVAVVGYWYMKRSKK